MLTVQLSVCPVSVAAFFYTYKHVGKKTTKKDKKTLGINNNTANANNNNNSAITSYDDAVSVVISSDDMISNSEINQYHRIYQGHDISGAVVCVSV